MLLLRRLLLKVKLQPISRRQKVRQQQMNLRQKVKGTEYWNLESLDMTLMMMDYQVLLFLLFLKR